MFESKLRDCLDQVEMRVYILYITFSSFFFSFFSFFFKPQLLTILPYTVHISGSRALFTGPTNFTFQQLFH